LRFGGQKGRAALGEWERLSLRLRRWMVVWKSSVSLLLPPPPPQKPLPLRQRPVLTHARLLKSSQKHRSSFSKDPHLILAFLNTCPSSCRPPPFVPYRKLLRAMDIFKYDPGACGGCDLSPVSILLFHFKSMSPLLLGVEERNRRNGCMRGRWGRRRQRPRWRTHACKIFTT
jgi:hypothetical protein